MTSDRPATTDVAVTSVVDGTAAGPALVLDEPLSMWGGLDAETGRIIDQLHPQHDTVVTGTVIIMPFGRGSSSASSILVEAVRLGTAPVAFVLHERDALIALGCLVAEELYRHTVPLVVGRPDELSAITNGDLVELEPGLVRIRPSGDTESRPPSTRA